LSFPFVEVSDRVDHIINSFLWFWGSDDGFFVISSHSTGTGQRGCISQGLEVRGVRSTRFLRAVPGHMSLLFAKETSSFCHESFLLFFAEGVPGADGIHVHCIWVTRGGTSSLSTLSKATLPLVPCAQAPLISHLWAEREDGFLGEILSHLVLCCLLPLWHGVRPDVSVHNRI
jgi:hypothetical protein